MRSDIKAGIESIFAQNKVAYNDAKTLFDTALLDYATMKDSGIESIFAQNKVAYNDAKTLFDTALLDYATMKDSLKLADRLKIRDRKNAYNDAKTLFDTALLDYATMKDSLKLADRLKIRDRKNTNEKALQSLLDFAKGQGDKEANLDAITKALPQGARAHIEIGARAHIEIAMLEELFRKSMLEVRDIQVFNSTKFLDNVKELKGTFTSKAAHDYINAAEKFHALFKNDPLILQAIKPATTDKIGSSIATTLEGAVKFQAKRHFHFKSSPRLHQRRGEVSRAF